MTTLLQTTDEQIVEYEKRHVQRLAGVDDLSLISLNDVGWTSRVYIINDGQFVVKFPRSERVKKEYVQEIFILKALEQVETGVLLPKIRWTHPDNDYLGYEGIVGIAFDQVAERVDGTTKRSVGKTIGTFLKQLHSISHEFARKMTVDDEIREFQEKYQLGIPVISSELTQDEQARLERLMGNEMPSELLRLGSNAALCHGDLGYWNMIFTEDNQVGVIDFGDVGLYDRSKDFIGLDDSEVLEEALKVYGNDDTLIQKIAIRQKVLPILDLPFFIGKNDRDGIQRTISRIKKAINE